jgi:hypothetical protein
MALVEAKGANIAPDMRVFETGALRVEYSSGNPKNLDVFFTGQRMLCMVWSDTTACIIMFRSNAWTVALRRAAAAP